MKNVIIVLFALLCACGSGTKGMVENVNIGFPTYLSSYDIDQYIDDQNMLEVDPKRSFDFYLKDSLNTTFLHLKNSKNTELQQNIQFTDNVNIMIENLSLEGVIWVKKEVTLKQGFNYYQLEYKSHTEDEYYIIVGWELPSHSLSLVFSNEDIDVNKINDAQKMLKEMEYSGN